MRPCARRWDPRRPDGSRRPVLGTLARVFLRLGLTAFGGPAAHIALFREEAKQLSAQIRTAAKTGKRDDITRAHLVESAGTLDEALKAPLVRQGV